MSNRCKISVTLSGELLDHLRSECQRLHVPLNWLVAGLVLDTSESAAPTAWNCDRLGFLHRVEECAI
jgi:hypothetical protein